MQKTPKLLRRLRPFLFLSVFMLCSLFAQASHFRGGNIKWERMPGNPYQIKFTVTESWRMSAFFGSTPSIGATAGTGSFYTGINYVSVNLIVTSVNATEDWFSGTFVYIENFPATPATYVAFEESCCRIGGLSNNNGGNFRVESVVTLGNNNDCPVSSVPPFINMPRNTAAATYQIPATDPNGDALTFSLTPANAFGSGTVQPSGLTVSSSGLLTFNTTSMSAGQLWSTSVKITDSKGATTMVDLMIKITNPSTPPTYDYSVTPANSASYLLQPGQNLSFNVKAQDADAGDIVTLSGAGLPAGSSFTSGSGNPVTRSFSWTPTSGQLGTYLINFTAQDAAGIQTNTIVNITVSLKPNFNVGPSLGNNSMLCALPGVAISQQFQASDPDVLDRVILTAPVTTSGMSFSPTLPTAAANPVSTTLSWTPLASNWGINKLVMKATDTYSESAFDTVFYIVNNPPSITSTPGTSVIAGQPYSYLLTATDLDLAYGDELEIEHIVLPSFLSVVDNHNGTWTISGTPTLLDAGTHSIDIEIADSMNHIGSTHCGAAFQNFSLEVLPCNITTSTSVTDATCVNNADGAIDLTVNNATAPVTITWSNAASTEDISGLTTGTYSVSISDANGCTASDAATVGYTADVTAPAVTCPANISVNNDAGVCGAAVTFAATATDYCTASPTITYTPAPGTIFPVGTTTVTVVATDAANNSSTCSFTVTVTDAENPTIASQSNIAVNNDNGICGAVVTYNAPVGTDNCPGASTSQTAGLASGVIYPVGVTTNTFVVTDAHGNTATTSFNVTVTDTENPTIAGLSNIAVNNDNGICGAVVTYNAPVGADNCPGASTSQTAGLASGATYPVGTTTNTFVVTDAHGNTATTSFNVTVTDNEKPNAICKNYTLNLSGGAGSITTANINNGSTDNCGIASMSLSKTNFTCANAGANTVTLTVTDIYGNSSSCNATVTVQYKPTCAIAVTPANNTYTGGVPTNIYLGYGPQSATASCNATGGTGFTYSWYPATNLSCSNCQSPVFTPTTAGNYSYTVTATNSNGCSTTCTVTFCVLDIRVTGTNGNNAKVYLCHVPPGNPGNPQTLSISVNAVPSHIGQHSGDRLGSCNQSCGSAKGQSEEGGLTTISSENFNIYPNPTNGIFTIEIPYTVKVDKIVVMDMTGKVIDAKTNITGNTKFDLSNVARGMYMIQVMYGNEAYRAKISVQ